MTLVQNVKFLGHNRQVCNILEISKNLFGDFALRNSEKEIVNGFVSIEPVCIQTYNGF